MTNGIFGSVPVDKVRRSKFNLSHRVNLTGQFGKLMPVLAEPCIPGESWRWDGNLMLRMAPLIAPIKGNVKATFHLYNVPYRILSTFFKDFITGGPDGEDSEQPPVTQVGDLLGELHGMGQAAFEEHVGTSSLWDYMGMPTIPWNAGGAFIDTTEINVFAFLAYACIWQYNYKDQNIDTDSVMESPIAAGPIASATMVQEYLPMRYRAWEKDPFTSALPWPQRGPDVLIPIEGTGDVTYKTVSDVINTVGIFTADRVLGTQPAGAGPHPLKVNMVVGGYDGDDGRIENIASVTFNNTTITVNDFRTAIVMQRWFEANARGGSRYPEVILQHYDWKVPDYVVDQPEYVGGVTMDVNISEVLTTANSLNADDENVPPGNMSGHGIVISGSRSFTYTAREHGMMMVILSVMPEASYQQGIPRKFLLTDRLEYPWPMMAGLGEQQILSKEIYYNPLESTAVNNALFGYQQRWWEWKMIPNRTCGDFRDTLDHWTTTRQFSSRPELDPSFVYMNPAEVERIFALEDSGATDKLWIEVWHNISVLRAMPYFSVPGLMKI